jgi:transmembrane sensor
MTPDRTDDDEDRLMRDAAGWFARMRAPDADVSRPGFEAWLAADPDHRRAYNRASEIFAMGKLLAQPAVSAPVAAAAPRRHWPVAASVAAILALGAGAWLSTRPPDRGQAEPAARIATRPAAGSIELAAAARRPREHKLADGSRVAMAGGTRLRLAYTGAERRLVLLEGRARFDVFHEARPFVVAVGGGTVTARGTLFEVALGPGGHVSVRLFRGRVDVALPSVTGKIPVRKLEPGQSLSFTALAPASAAPAAGQAGAVTRTRDYEAIPLSLLIAEANHRSARPIRIDPALGGRRVSGRFRIDETGLLADRLARLFDLQVDRSDPARLVLKPR